MKEFLCNTFRGDKILWVIFGLFLALSALEMYSASSSLAYKQSSYFMPVWSHITFLCVGFLVAFVMHLFSPKVLMVMGPVLYVFALFMLVYVLFSGVSVNEASRWASIMGVRFQPSELAKLALVINLAIMLQLFTRENIFSKKVAFGISLGLAGLLCMLIFPENFSTAILCGGVTFTMMFYARVPLKWLGKTIAALVIMVVLFFGIAQILPENAVTHRTSVWVHRLSNFHSGSEEDKFVIDDKNYQEAHAKIAISNSNYVGKGIGNSIERDFLPQAFSDFIFAIIIEEMGIGGALVVLLLYMILLYRAAIIARDCDSVYSAILVLGLSTMIVFQAFINMAVAVGLFPVTGQPLPLISRGGTSIVITSAYFGLMLGVSRDSLQKESSGGQKEKKVKKEKTEKNE
ncbi:MAG: FtsW/RodA/SpoVE family cell cycle protein [Paludibacteraceae bacterium]|nr:FtsW/RodA/SpoVE family cell cycle protein [Paludibacteraceae bacterium]